VSRASNPDHPKGRGVARALRRGRTYAAGDGRRPPPAAQDNAPLRESTGRRFEWLASEILSFRGEGVVVEPPELRKAIAQRAAELTKELGVSRVRAKA
jgi:hypothetical protein